MNPPWALNFLLAGVESDLGRHVTTRHCARVYHLPTVPVHPFNAFLILNNLLSRHRWRIGIFCSWHIHNESIFPVGDRTVLRGYWRDGRMRSRAGISRLVCSHCFLGCGLGNIRDDPLIVFLLPFVLAVHRKGCGCIIPRPPRRTGVDSARTWDA